ncbi:MAG TPA: LegC family aminotransferase [Salinivirgaceae bacterium]|nr:LegC family aminotransferase [Salinivirgaceae bacterium]
MNHDFQKIIQFIRNTFNEPTEFIPLHEPRFIGNEKQYLLECIDTNFVSSVGEFVNRFEKACADFTGAQYAVAAMNGTAALHIALLLASVKPGDIVITQPLTFIATANAISYTGAEPFFVDVDPETMGISVDSLEEFLLQKTYIGKDGQCYEIETSKRIAAVVPMHTFGFPVKIDRLVALCAKHNIPCVEDAAESLGSYYNNQHTGTFGIMGILSFNGNKIITTGGGGMILTNNEKLARRAKHLTTQAKVPHRWEFVHDEIGYNYRLTNIQAALGCAQIEQLPLLLEKKRAIAHAYQQFFAQTPYRFFSEPANSKSNYWLNAILFNNRKERDEFLEFSNNQNVMTRPLWEMMTRLPMFKHCRHTNLHNAEWFADRVVNIPSSPIIEGYRKNRSC